MDKLEINNQIIRMRKHVKRAKVHAINKLVKEVKLLQNRRGKEEQVQKAKRKADRYREEIILIKKMKIDCISKLALSKAKNWKDVLIQRSSTLEDRCHAILANYESVQREVEKFHAANPDLVPKIPDCVKEWEVKRKLPKLPDFRKLKFDKNNIEMIEKYSNRFCTSSNREVLGTNFLKKSNVDLEDNEEIEGNLPLADKNREREIIPSMNKAENKSKSIEAQNTISPVKQFENSNFRKKVSSNEDIANDYEDSEMINEESSEVGETDDSESKVGESDDSESKVGETDDSESDNINVDNTLDNKSNLKKQNNYSKNIDLSDVDCKNNFKAKKIKLSDRIENSGSEVLNETVMIPEEVRPDRFVQSSKKSAEKNLKSIAILNLDDFEGLDEIHITKATDEEDESDEEEDQDASEKMGDSFFLQPGEFDSVSENKQFDRSRQKKTAYVPKPENLNTMNRFERRNGRPKKGFQKSENNSHFQKRESSNFKRERGFRKDSFPPKSQDGFQNKGRKTFQSKDEKGFNRSGQNSFPNFKGQSFTKESNKPPFSNEANGSFRENKSFIKKGNDTSEKPLHPSWEAKRKQKESTQAAFKGKRMVFND